MSEQLSLWATDADILDEFAEAYGPRNGLTAPQACLDAWRAGKWVPGCMIEIVEQYEERLPPSSGHSQYSYR